MGTKIIATCPRCKLNNQVVTGGNPVGSWGNDGWLVRSCNGCDSPMFLVYSKLETKDRTPLFCYPLVGGQLDAGTVFPDHVREEYDEAAKCLSIEAYLASMTMTRRVVQRCLKQLGHDQHRLVDQIDAAKTAGDIPKRYHDLVDEIRKFGNVGAHPDDEELPLANRENATILLDCARVLLDEFFVLQQKVARLTKNRQQA